eukprot:jgi/Mesen1/7362/ME000381S06605
MGVKKETHVLNKWKEPELLQTTSSSGSIGRGKEENRVAAGAGSIQHRLDLGTAESKNTPVPGIEEFGVNLAEVERLEAEIAREISQERALSSLSEEEFESRLKARGEVTGSLQLANRVGNSSRGELGDERSPSTPVIGLAPRGIGKHVALTQKGALGRGNDSSPPHDKLTSANPLGSGANATAGAELSGGGARYGTAGPVELWKEEGVPQHSKQGAEDALTSTGHEESAAKSFTLASPPPRQPQQQQYLQQQNARKQDDEITVQPGDRASTDKGRYRKVTGGGDAGHADAGESREDELEDTSEEEAVWFEPLAGDAPPRWPHRLVLSAAVGYQMSNLTVLIRSFQEHVPNATLVLFATEKPEEWVPQERVVLQLYHQPEEGLLTTLHPTSMRVVLYRVFLTVVRHRGRVLLCDARDVVFLGDPFAALDDDAAHFFLESARLPAEGQRLTMNHRWLARCYNKSTAYLLGGKRVINGGFLLGRTRQLLLLLREMHSELRRLPSGNCTRLLGADQAILIHTLYSGQASSKFKFKLEDNEHGPVLLNFSKRKVYETLASGMPANPVDRAPYIAIHGYDRFTYLDQLVKNLYPASNVIR